MDGEIEIEEVRVSKYEAVTDLDNSLPPIYTTENATLVLFLVDRNAPMSLKGTISGKR